MLIVSNKTTKAVKFYSDEKRCLQRALAICEEALDAYDFLEDPERLELARGAFVRLETFVHVALADGPQKEFTKPVYPAQILDEVEDAAATSGI